MEKLRITEIFERDQPFYFKLSRFSNFSGMTVVQRIVKKIRKKTLNFYKHKKRTALKVTIFRQQQCWHCQVCGFTHFVQSICTVSEKLGSYPGNNLNFPDFGNRSIASVGN